MRQSTAPVCRLVVMLGLLACVGSLTALAQDTASFAFEVASVKPGLEVSWSRGIK